MKADPVISEDCRILLQAPLVLPLQGAMKQSPAPHKFPGENTLLSSWDWNREGPAAFLKLFVNNCLQLYSIKYAKNRSMQKIK